MPQGGRLTFTAKQKGEHIEVEVSDTGVGIGSDMLPRVFEPFMTTV